MANIINKSNHPVQIKKIDVKTWKIRDEIIQAITDRLEVNPENKNIEDIKNFYSREIPELEYEDFDIDEVEDDEDEGDDLTNESLGDKSESKEEEKDESESKGKKDSEGEDVDESDNETEKSKKDKIKSADQKSEDSTVNEVELKRTIPDSASMGFTLLSDVYIDEMLFSSTEKYLTGQTIALEFLIPQSFIISLQVKGCQHIPNQSKIIREKQYEYRVLAKCINLWSGERDNLRNFLTSIEPDIPPTSYKVKTLSREEGDNEDDLDDFDL